MFDLKYEKNKKISTEQMSMILDLAAQAASDGGFMSSYIFYRAMYVFAAQVLYPEKKDVIASSIGSGYDIRLAFDLLVKDGTIEDMQSHYQDEMKELDTQGLIWMNEVREYQQSARGLVDSVNTISGDIVKTAVEQLQNVAKGDVKVINDFADHWGFDRADVEIAPKKKDASKNQGNADIIKLNR